MSTLTDSLTPFAEAGALDPLAVQFARAMARLVPDQGELVLLGAAAASAAVARGHICCDLSRAARLLAPREEPQDHPHEFEELRWPEPARWRAALASSPLVTTGDDKRPLVLRGDRLYLHRYWAYERRLARALAQRATAAAPDVDGDLLSASLERLFPAAPSPLPRERGRDLQRQAAATAVTRRLAIITGGPGTGKTSTVVRVLAALLEQDAELRIQLVAPTGKAAARMSESIRHAKADEGRLVVDERIRALIPEEAGTIHRALGWQYGTPTRFRHGADHWLPADVVVADEASMVDLALMTKLVEAVRPDARLILLGDKDQLASVEAGNVLGELCEADTLAACRVELLWSHRFGPESGIAALARAINEGDADAALALLGDEGRPDIRLVAPTSAGPLDLDALLRPLAEPAFRAQVSRRGAPKEALDALAEFQILCAHRRGRFGAEAVGEAAERWLTEAGLIPRAAEAHYEGRPLMITTNDYQLQLFNGDLGVVMRDPEDGRLRVWFHDPRASLGGSVRKLVPAQLPPHETLFATTVHKGQGSGYERVVIVLPPELSPVLNRALLYTAVTRAKREVILIASPEIIRHAVLCPVERASGLEAQLDGEAPR